MKEIYKPKKNPPKKKELFPPKSELMYRDLDNAHQILKAAETANQQDVAQVASAEFEKIDMSLKKEGAIPVDPQEEIEFALDKEYPNAKNSDVVIYQGKQYRLKFLLLATRPDGKRVWGREWNELAKEKYKELFPATTVTLEEYEAMKEWVKTLQEEAHRDDGDKVSWLGRQERRSNRIHEAQGERDRAEISLKKRGLLPVTAQDQLDFELDKKAYGMRNGQILEHEQRFFRLRFIPYAKSNTGKTVHVWMREWEEVQNPDKKE